MHEYTSGRRGGLSARAGALLLALITCLGIGQLLAAAPAQAASSSVAAKRSAYNRMKVINEVRRHVGRPYVFGAAGPRSFDCSGLTQYVYRRAVGVRLPHKADLQQRYGRPVPRNKPMLGDLIVFRSGSYAYHIGIYAGGGYMYDAPRPGQAVGKHKIWSSGYVVRRLL